MDWITDDILIGNYLDAQDAEALTENGVKSIINLTGDELEMDYTALGIRSVRKFRLIDGAGNEPELFLNAVKALRFSRKRLPPVLVHCHAGQSRSAVVVAVHLMKDVGMELQEAMELISKKREVRITAGLQEALFFASD